MEISSVVESDPTAGSVNQVGATVPVNNRPEDDMIAQFQYLLDRIEGPGRGGMVDQANLLRKAISALTFVKNYRISHPDENVAALRFVDLTIPVYDRLELKTKHIIDPDGKILTKMSEVLTARNLGNEVISLVESGSHGIEAHLPFYSLVRPTPNGGSQSLQDTLTVYVENACQKLDMNRIIIEAPNMYIHEDHPLSFTTTEKKTTLLYGPITGFGLICVLPGGDPDVMKHISSESDYAENLERLREVDLIEALHDSTETWRSLFKNDLFVVFTEPNEEFATAMYKAVPKCLAFIQKLGAKNVSWCMNNGYSWVFGIIIRSDDKPDVFSYITDVRKIEDKQDIEEILKTLVYYTTNSPSDVLNLYEIVGA